MRSETSSFRLEYPDLAAVLAEIIERLCRDDWERRSSADGELVYYTVGFTAHQIDAHRLTEFTSTFPIPNESTPLTRWFTRAQIAGAQPDHEAISRKHARTLGLTDEKIDAFLACRLDELKELDLGNRPDLLVALAQCLEGAVLTSGRRPVDDVTSEERKRISRDRAKAYLREIGDKFRALLKRIAKMDALDFADPQMEEASRCYMYGFRRGAVVLAAAAVETHLKRVTGKDWFKKYEELIQPAVWAGDLDKGWGEAARRIFEMRRRVVHHAHDPSPEETATTLDLARAVVGSLQGDSSDEA
jgi:hypothetical protein